jgi:hypothetical protein
MLTGLVRVLALDGSVWHVAPASAAVTAALTSTVVSWSTPDYVAGLTAYDRMYWETKVGRFK